MTEEWTYAFIDRGPRFGFCRSPFRYSVQTSPDPVKIVGTIALCLLLFSMGMSSGSNPEIIASLPLLGAKALTSALSIIAGSTFVVWLGVRFSKPPSRLFKQGRKQPR